MIAAAVCLVLVFVALEDLRHFRIRNSAILVLVACFALETALHGTLASAVAHLVFGALALLVLMFAFSRGWLGGGDAKLLAVALLWVGPEGSLVFSLALTVATLLYSAGALLGRLPGRSAGGRFSIPYGPSMAAAWMAAIAWSSSM